MVLNLIRAGLNGGRAEEAEEDVERLAELDEFGPSRLIIIIIIRRRWGSHIDCSRSAPICINISD